MTGLTVARKVEVARPADAAGADEELVGLADCADVGALRMWGAGQATALDAGQTAARAGFAGARAVGVPDAADAVHPVEDLVLPLTIIAGREELVLRAEQTLAGRVYADPAHDVAARAL